MLQMSSGMLQSPGYLYGMYPNNMLATWTVSPPSGVTAAMSARIQDFDLYKDSDFLKVN